MEQFPAPNPEEMLAKGSIDKNGNASFREENGQFMSREKVAAIGAEAHAHNPAAQQLEAEAWVDNEVASGNSQPVDPEADAWVKEQLGTKQNDKSKNAEYDSIHDPIDGSNDKVIDDWAKAEFNGDEKAAKEAQDKIQDIMVDAFNKGVIKNEEVSGIIDRLHDLKEMNKAERAALLGELKGKIAAIEAANQNTPADQPGTAVEKYNQGVTPGMEVELYRGSVPAVVEGDDVPDVELIPDDDVPDIELFADDETGSPSEATIEELVKGIESELDPSLLENLKTAREAFIAASVKRRGANFRHGKELQEAKTAYDTARNEAGKAVAAALKGKLAELGLDEKNIQSYLRTYGKQGALLELHEVTNGIKNAQLEQADAKVFKKFYQKWAEWGGKGNHKGKFKKVAAMAAIGFVPGVGLAAAGAALLGPVVGGAIAGGMARGVGRNLFRGRVQKNADAKHVAEAQADDAISRGEKRINESFRLSAESVSGVSYDSSEQIRKRNRNRVVGSVALGAAFATGGAVLGNFLSGRDLNRAIDRPFVDKPQNLELQGGRPTLVDADQTPPTLPRIVETPTPQVPVEVIPPAPNLPAGYETNMPWTNAAELFESPDPRGLIQSTLDEYNARSGHTFEWRQDGMFWEGGRVINPAELAEYNRVMAELATGSSDTLPVTA